MVKNPIKIRVFSDRPIDLNIIWIFIVLLLILLSIFLGYKYSQKCPDVACDCPEQRDCPDLDCTTCPEKIVYRNITSTITKFECADRVTIVDNLDDCVAGEKKLDVKPIKTNEEGTYIEQSKVNSTCVNGINGGLVYYKLGVTPNEVVFEVKEVGKGDYEAKKTFPGLLTKFRYFTICNPNDVGCQNSADFYLDKFKIYLFRIKFDEKSTTGKIEYSNEYVIDTTSTSDFMTRKCSR